MPNVNAKDVVVGDFIILPEENFYFEVIGIGHKDKPLKEVSFLLYGYKDMVTYEPYAQIVILQRWGDHH